MFVTNDLVYANLFFLIRNYEPPPCPFDACTTTVGLGLNGYQSTHTSIRQALAD